MKQLLSKLVLLIDCWLIVRLCVRIDEGDPFLP